MSDFTGGGGDKSALRDPCAYGAQHLHGAHFTRIVELWKESIEVEWPVWVRYEVVAGDASAGVPTDVVIDRMECACGHELLCAELSPENTARVVRAGESGFRRLLQGA